MKLIVKSERTRLFIVLPTALILNRLSAVIATRIIKSKWTSIDISTEDLLKLIGFIKSYKRKHRYWEVVNISLADGGIVYVSL